MAEINEKRAVLVSIAERTSDLPECNISLDELERLLETAGGVCFAKVVQVKDSFDPRTCIGRGKVEEIRELCRQNDISLVIFDFELSPAQIRNLEGDIGDVTVIDRSMLILDIFALHAASGEGKLQVELAQLKYTAPRLTGRGIELSRQGGGIGSRGPGESKLETDRRHLKERVVTLERRLSELEHNRAIMRTQRDRSGIVKIALVGYTNAGKSTLLNALTGADVLCEDKLFATLDPTTRKTELPSGRSVLFTDTVGFIRNLPHHLVKAFKSTLDEIRFADILLLVSDATDDEAESQIKITEQLICELGAAEKTRIYVYNKVDKKEDAPVGIVGELSVAVSAARGDGIDALIDLISEVADRTSRTVKLSIPYGEENVLSSVYKAYGVSSTEYTDLGTVVTVVLDEKGRGQYSKYILGDV